VHGQIKSQHAPLLGYFHVAKQFVKLAPISAGRVKEHYRKPPAGRFVVDPFRAAVDPRKFDISPGHLACVA
jgi:hypothetical protein